MLFVNPTSCFLITCKGHDWRAVCVTSQTEGNIRLGVLSGLGHLVWLIERVECVSTFPTVATFSNGSVCLGCYLRLIADTVVPVNTLVIYCPVNCSAPFSLVRSNVG